MTLLSDGPMPVVPLTPEQRSLRFNECLLGPGIMHNLTASVEFPTGVDTCQVRETVATLVDRQAALRCALTQDGHQRIGRPEPRLSLLWTDDLDGVLDLRFTQLHDVELFAREHPFRARFEHIRGDDRQALLVSVDHAIADGHSVGLIIDTLKGLLGLDGHLAPDPPVTPYDDQCWQQVAAARRHDATETAAWRVALSGVEPLFGLMPHDDIREEWVRTQQDLTVPGSALNSQVRGLATKLRVTPFVLVAALVSAAVWRSSGRTAFVIHTPVTTRRGPAAWGTVGYMINERPIVCRIHPAESFAAHVARIHDACVFAMKHSFLAEPDLVERVPELGAALETPGCDYLQLHASYGAEPLPGVAHGADASERTERSTVLGPYTPAGDLTCTTIRFALHPEHTQVRTFFGGPPFGFDAATLLTDRIINTMSTIRDDLDRPLADVV